MVLLLVGNKQLLSPTEEYEEAATTSGRENCHAISRV
jgi:hypothetical protein